MILWTSIALFAGLGSLGFVAYLRALAVKPDIASQILWYSLASWALAALIYGGKWVVDFFFR